MIEFSTQYGRAYEVNQAKDAIDAILSLPTREEIKGPIEEPIWEESQKDVAE